MDDTFLVGADELDLRFAYRDGTRQLAFDRHEGPPEVWRQRCRSKLQDLIALSARPTPEVRRLRDTEVEGIRVEAWVMTVDEGLTIPGYLLLPSQPWDPPRTMIAIHGHGEVGPCLGTSSDYHHAFALRMAQAGAVVLCPELRGFGVLRDVAVQREDARLDYWNWDGHKAYSLVTDGFLHGRTLIGDTVADLLAWEDWLCAVRDVATLDVVGISYGGDLALIYPPFSQRVARIFASGTLGSFSVIFDQCYNAPAHCVPGVLHWMDRADIAGLNAPRPIALHYGALDTPGDDNYSASYNETVPGSLEALRAIYRAFGAEDQVSLFLSLDSEHEMDNEVLREFLGLVR
jgi:dienelactone hydrolase